MDERLEERKMMRVERERVLVQDDLIIREAPLTIYLNGLELVTLLYTPELAEMLAVGFLRSEGMINDFSDISSLRYDSEKDFIFVEAKGVALAKKLYGKRTITSGCGKGTVFYDVLDALKSQPVRTSLLVSQQQIARLMHQLQERAVLFQKTGGIHSAALCQEEQILYSCEDIGRHNAVDKIIGLCLKNREPLENKILATSGRVSSEILIKTAKLGIGVLISRAAPTTLSIDLAESLGITLIGFARGQRFNVYTNLERIVID